MSTVQASMKITLKLTLLIVVIFCVYIILMSYGVVLWKFRILVMRFKFPPLGSGACACACVWEHSRLLHHDDFLLQVAAYLCDSSLCGQSDPAWTRNSTLVREQPRMLRNFSFTRKAVPTATWAGHSMSTWGWWSWKGWTWRVCVHIDTTTFVWISI